MVDDSTGSALHGELDRGIFFKTFIYSFFRMASYRRSTDALFRAGEEGSCTGEPARWMIGVGVHCTGSWIAGSGDSQSETGCQAG